MGTIKPMSVMRFPGGKAKAVTMSYDDGVRTDRRLIQIMNQHGLKGTFNLNGGLFAENDVGNGCPTGRMTYKEAQEVFCNSGQEVAIHGLHHGFFQYMSNAEANYEVCEDRRILEDLTGKPVRGMAYPFGSYSEALLNILASNEIAYSRTVRSHYGFHLPENFLTWHPTCHHKYDKLEELTARFLSETPGYGHSDCMLFYLWGHSYEFENDNNWEIIEHFAEKMGNRKDIWYASNIDIFRYIKAYERMEFNVEGTQAYNPSAIDVWMDRMDWKQENKTTVCVPAGETVTLMV